MPLLMRDLRGNPKLEHNLVVNAKDGSVLVRIPAGEFEMGDGKDESCPKHLVYVSEYWIGVYCVTNRQYGRFVRETKYGGEQWKEPGKPEHPAVGVSWHDAVAYSEWAGLSLPTEPQWEKAARGPSGLIYPWGGGWEEGKKCRNKAGGQTAEVSSYPLGVSGYGTYQQSGNVWECCADWYDKDYYKSTPPRDPKGPKTGPGRVIRGGGWWLNDAPRFRGAYRGWGDPGDRRCSFQGFRLVRNIL